MLRRAITAFSLSAFFVCAPLLAGQFSFAGATDKAVPLYAPGEKMVFKIQLLEDGKPVDGVKLKWTRSGDDQKTESGESVSSATAPLSIATSLDKPGFVKVEVQPFDKDGKQIQGLKNRSLSFCGGAGVDIDKLQGVPEPADFDAFWAKQKARLAEVPLKAELKDVISSNPKFKVYDVKVDCAGARPVSGYLSVPFDANDKSQKAYVVFSGYGVGGAAQIFRDDGICLQINAHGIENGREKEYYDNLVKNELKSYAFHNQENAKPETAYFNGMMLRVMRALEYIKTRQEWNGRDLIVSGGSQGGLQCISAAALDKDVTCCNANVPWCCDLGGVSMGRMKGWRPDWTPALGYYDIVNQAKRVKCKTDISAGLGDYVCPPSGVTILYNNLSCPKSVEFIQGMKHGYFDYPAPKDDQKFKLESK